MKFITNAYDPRNIDYSRVDRSLTNDTKWDIIRECLDRPEVVGLPQATEHFTVEELQAQGIVGVYDA